VTLFSNNLTARIARRIFGIVLASLLAAGVLLALSVWQDEHKRLELLIKEVSTAFAVPLAESIWLVDSAQVQSQLQAMTRINGISRVSVRTFMGQELRFGRSGSLGDDTFAVRQTELSHLGRSVGTLRVYADRGALTTAIIEHLLQMLLIQVLVFGSVGTALYLVINREAARPLARITSRLAAWRPFLNPEPFVFSRPVSTELASLATTINGMQVSLSDHLRKEEQLKAELEHHRDQLAALADSRGRSLSYQEGLKQRALAMSTALINLPQSMILPQIRQSLADIAHHSTVDYIGVLRPQGDAGATLETLWDTGRATNLVDRVASTQTQLGQLVRLRRSPGAVHLLDGMTNRAAISPTISAVLSDLGFDSIIAIPLQVRDEGHGTLLMGRTEKAAAWPEQEVSFFELLGQIVASALAQQSTQEQLASTCHTLKVANAELTRLSCTDPLTGLANRRGFDEARARELSRARRTKSLLALILIDVDHFKAYNDSCGHAEGDICLVSIAAALREVLHRPSDLATRVGGEEFALLLPDTDLEGAQRVFAELRQVMHRLALPHPASPVARIVTLSAGIALHDAVGEQTFEEFYVACDQALYAAKHGGRDRCMTAA